MKDMSPLTTQSSLRHFIKDFLLLLSRDHGVQRKNPQPGHREHHSPCDRATVRWGRCDEELLFRCKKATWQFYAILHCSTSCQLVSLRIDKNSETSEASVPGAIRTLDHTSASQLTRVVQGSQVLRTSPRAPTRRAILVTMHSFLLASCYY